jgi:hypothetical protein
VGEKGEEEFPEINDTTIAETEAVAPEETTSSEEEGRQYYDLPEPGEVEKPQMGVRRRKAKKSKRSFVPRPFDSSSSRRRHQ